uniref:MADS43 n=1 Tax=Erycina pusilla TaxID=154679 RepID=A0A1L1WKX6_9ASPA|nr:MADS43 [Erycina pusilla]
MGGKGRKNARNKLKKNYSSRMVCFSKRRKGLMKKTEEISILTGVNISALTISKAGKFYYSDKQVLDSLLCPKLVDISPQKEIEMPSETGTDVDEMIQEFLSSDVPMLNSQLFSEHNISLENVAWESEKGTDVGEMIQELLSSDVEDMFPEPDFSSDNVAWESLFHAVEAYDICEEKEVNNSMNFDYDVQIMGCEELERLEKAIMEDMKMKLSN